MTAKCILELTQNLTMESEGPGMTNMNQLKLKIKLLHTMSNVYNKLYINFFRFFNQLQGTHWEGWEIKLLEKALKQQK